MAKHAVVAISEDLYQAMNVAMLPVGEGRNPRTEADMPGVAPAKQLTAEIRRLLAGPGGAS